MTPRLRGLVAALACAALVSGVRAAAAAPRAAPQPVVGGCAQPRADSIVFVEMPGHPFQVVPSSDGCWFFVSVLSSNPRSLNGVAVLRRENGRASVVRMIPVEPQPTGMVLTHDGTLLVVSDDEQVVFMDTERMRSGKGDPILGYLSDGEGSSSVYANCTRDDRWLFVSDEWTQTITVIDLARARSGGFKPDAIVGKIPVGRAPVALTFSPDQRYLYTTSQVAAKDWGWKAECVPEGGDPAAASPTEAQGAVVVVDVERAKQDPAHSVVARVPAGCHPVRLALSAQGNVAFVTARKSNTMLAFDTAKLLADSTRARIGAVPVGTAPVGVAVGRAGGREVVVVANSNRFGGTAAPAESLSVIDAAQVGAGAAAVIGRIPAGGFPRELRVIDDGRTLVVTNYNSNTVELVDLERLAHSWTPR